MRVHAVNDASDPGSHRFPSKSPRGVVSSIRTPCNLNRSLCQSKLCSTLFHSVNPKVEQPRMRKFFFFHPISVIKFIHEQNDALKKVLCRLATFKTQARRKSHESVTKQPCCCFSRLISLKKDWHYVIHKAGSQNQEIKSNQTGSH